MEPPATRWEFPDPAAADGDVVAVGGDLEPGTVLAAYRSGIFPMPLEGELAWWSPDPRGVLPLDAFRQSRSLRKSRATFEVRVDTAFSEVIDACADPSRPHGWITPAIQAAYRRLHELGWAHSIEAWSRDDGTLAGGLYGLEIGGLFAGESMFHRRTDASKAALAWLVERLATASGGHLRLIDVQWRTDHLASLGAVTMPRTAYLALVRSLVAAGIAPALAANIRNRP